MSSRRIVSLAVLVGIGVLAVMTAAVVASAPPTIVLEKPLHFLASSGEDVVAEPGTYEVETLVGARLRLRREGSTPLFIDAQAVAHEETLEMAVAGGQYAAGHVFVSDLMVRHPQMSENRR